MLESLESEFSLWDPFVVIKMEDSVVEVGVIHPFHIEFVDGASTDVESLSNLSETHSGAIELKTVFVGIVLIKLLG